MRADRIPSLLVGQNDDDIWAFCVIAFILCGSLHSSEHDAAHEISLREKEKREAREEQQDAPGRRQVPLSERFLREQASDQS